MGNQVQTNLAVWLVSRTKNCQCTSICRLWWFKRDTLLFFDVSNFHQPTKIMFSVILMQNISVFITWVGNSLVHLSTWKVQNGCGPTTNHGSPRHVYAVKTSTWGGFCFLRIAHQNMRYNWRQEIVAVVVCVFNQYFGWFLGSKCVSATVNGMKLKLKNQGLAAVAIFTETLTVECDSQDGDVQQQNPQRKPGKN